jgi:hypothetical protein
MRLAPKAVKVRLSPSRSAGADVSATRNLLARSLMQAAKSSCLVPTSGVKNPLASAHGAVSAINIFRVQMLLGLVTWALVVVTYLVPWLNSLGRAEAQRAIAALNVFRFLGLVFILPGVVGPNLSAGFAVPAAYGDLATSLLAICAFVSFRIRPLFWGFVTAFNAVGAADLIDAAVRTVHFGVPVTAGQLGAAYGIVVIYVPLLMIAHIVAFYLLLSPERQGRAEKRAPSLQARA